ncbi:hypothetical protein AN958_08386 [Leucoagaricus sp. SymC.cos]|nr:hypothetical protein AN958_08386 [Leucoagaricus sp. SymC.cos]
MTANLNWEEIQSALLSGQTASDCPDIIAQVFEQRKKALVKEIMNGLFGNLSAAPSAALVDRATSLNDSLAALAGKPWSDLQDLMHFARALSVMVGHIFAAQGHVLPFDDSPTVPTLALALHDMLLHDAPQHPSPIHGTADSAAPLPSAPACGTPSEATAHPPLAPKLTPPPQPTQSTKHPPPPSSVKCSYADTVHDVTSLVNLAKTVPDLPSDHIIVMHQASVLLAEDQVNHSWSLSVAGPHQV